jgi:hypothetical protein
MTPFTNLFGSHLELSPGEQQRLVEQEFPALVARGPLHWWTPGESVADTRRLLIGAATYSRYDMRLLDLVYEAKCHSVAPASAQHVTSKGLGLVELAAEQLRVDVFSVLACGSHEDFSKYVPGIGQVFQTPVVGFWEKGILREKATGAAGRGLVARICGIDPKLLSAEVNHTGSNT